jgi:tRNA (guanosine-2'-O-)-methyltransferase
MKNPYETEKTLEQLRREEDILRPFVSDRRWDRMQAVLDERSRHIGVAVEDIFQPHNASAVLRSCDAFGVQDVHIIENRNKYRVNPGVELGTAQWLSLFRYQGVRPGSSVPPLEGTKEAFRALREKGYRIVATTPHRDAWDLESIPLETGPLVILFGAEKEGLSTYALDNADEYLKIPMRGFVESLNISVSAAITLQHLGARLRKSAVSWHLPAANRAIILNRWLRSSVKNSGAIIEREL